MAMTESSLHVRVFGEYFRRPIRQASVLCLVNAREHCLMMHCTHGTVT